ncbi:VWA domain-containing protein [Paenibacillus koleovorans]|uniref:VWA domain-containing protein n=1 Tax=Paenibacillus koleovorans TaxID=121608 RepID=UPI000FD7515F|nr:vWA domain-containing protein [Paenibacillus koleovorans]
MKQILLITDGCSNVGISPVAAAAHAQQEGIVVNVVGIVDDGEAGERGMDEIAEIARAGGGMSRLVTAAVLSQTVQAMTRKTVMTTMHLAVSRELRQILGTGELEALPPDKRGEVVRVIDDMSEQTPLRVALLIDTSASMKLKLKAVEETCRDLLLSLQARKGRSEMAVFHFPGRSDADLLIDWSSDLAKLQHLFYNLNIKGTTPTGPAIRQVLQHFSIRASERADRSDSPRYPQPRSDQKDGIWSDYVV